MILTSTDSISTHSAVADVVVVVCLFRIGIFLTDFIHLLCVHEIKIDYVNAIGLHFIMPF